MSLQVVLPFELLIAYGAGEGSLLEALSKVDIEVVSLLEALSAVGTGHA